MQEKVSNTHNSNTARILTAKPIQNNTTTMLVNKFHPFLLFALLNGLSYGKTDEHLNVKRNLRSNLDVDTTNNRLLQPLIVDTILEPLYTIPFVGDIIEDVIDFIFGNEDDELDDDEGDDDMVSDDLIVVPPDGTQFFPSDGKFFDNFGSSCAAKDDLIVVGSPRASPDTIGAAYLFRADGTQLAKLTPGAIGGPETYTSFGSSVSIDEKIVVSAYFGIPTIEVFDLDGNHERTLICDTCDDDGFAFGDAKTSGDKIVALGREGGDFGTFYLFVYSTSGSLLKKIYAGDSVFGNVAISDQYIASLQFEYNRGKVLIYENSSPDFPLRTEFIVPDYAREVEIAGDKLVISGGGIDSIGEAYLYTVDGTKIADLDRQDSTSDSDFGGRVAITDEYIVVGAERDSNVGSYSGAVYVYSSIDGSFVEKRFGENGDEFGACVCAYGPYYFVGASFAYANNVFSGAGYIFSFPV